MPPPIPPSDERDAHAPETARNPGRRKIPVLFIGGIVLVLGAALFARAFLVDEEPPDLSDLQVPRLNIPGEQNAYARLTKLTETLPAHPSESTPEEIHFARIFEDKVAWNQAVVVSVLDRYPPDLVASLRTALDTPESEAPEIVSFADLQPEIVQFRTLAKVLVQKAALASRAEDHSTAADLNLLALKLGNLLGRSRGGIITVLTATAIENSALDAIQKHVDETSIAPEILRRYLAQIAQHEIRPEDYHTAYKLEIRPFGDAIAQIDRNGLRSLTSNFKSPYGFVMTLPGLWQPNRTIRWHADCMRAAISETTMPDLYHAVLWPERAQNITGRILISIAVPALEKVSVAGHRARANLRLIQIYAALRLHQLEHQGALPAELGDLVPAYLPAIPADPFGGQPLRYDRALTTIWSVDDEARTVVDADDELPRGMPAYRLRFVRPRQPLPPFDDYQAQQDTGLGLDENP